MNEKWFGNISPNKHREEKKIEVKKEENFTMTRRRFLSGSLALATLAAAKLSSLPTEIKKEEKHETHVIPEEVGVLEEKNEKKIPKEDLPVVLTPYEQLCAYGEIRNLKEGLKVVYDKHYFQLSKTEDGLYDMKKATRNIARYDMKKMKEPFIKNDLPQELAYMIAIQETRGRNQKSHRGALGITGILPTTAKMLGFNAKKVNDPYLANRITAQYLAVEHKERFGDVNDIDILLHAYNAGGGLFGFTQVTKSKERTSENFYKYMENYINTKFHEVRERGYVHTVDKEDKNLVSICERFEIPLRKLLVVNNISEKTLIYEGDRLIIPFETLEDAAKIIFRKPMETLQYVPQLRAKYKALKDTGLLALIDPRYKQYESDLG